MLDDIEAAALRARLEAIIKDAEAQAAAARRRVQAARLLLEEEYKTAALEQTATAARQHVPSSSSSSSSLAAASQLVPTASSTYEDTVVAGLHLQAAAVLNVRRLVNIVLDSSTNYVSWRDLMEQALQRYSPFLNFLKVRDDLLLEEIHMDSIGPPAAPTALYTNATSPAAKPPSSTSSHPPNGGNGGTGGNRNKNNNKNRNSGNGGGNNGKNNNSGGGRGGSSGQTTAPIGSDGRTNAPWPTYGHPWQGHMTMYPGPVPVGQQRPQAFVATPGLYASPGLLSGPQQQ
jgi:uncharacterized membrane protein YgcG